MVRRARVERPFSQVLGTDQGRNEARSSSLQAFGRRLAISKFPTNATAVHARQDACPGALGAGAGTKSSVADGPHLPTVLFARAAGPIQSREVLFAGFPRPRTDFRPAGYKRSNSPTTTTTTTTSGSSQRFSAFMTRFVSRRTRLSALLLQGSNRRHSSCQHSITH